MADKEYLTVPNLTRYEIRRLFSKIMIDASTGCWLWTASVNTGGYGQFRFRGATERVHRIMYAWLVEPIPKGVSRDTPQLDHLACDTRACCCPTHLKLVTPRENVLRSPISPSAIWARRTHCANGHELPPSQSGTRRCKQCIKAYDASKFQARKKPRPINCAKGHPYPSEPNFPKHKPAYRRCLVCRRVQEERRILKRRQQKVALTAANPKTRTRAQELNRLAQLRYKARKKLMLQDAQPPHA